MDEEISKKEKSDLSLRIIAISLIVIAVSLGYFAIKNIKESRVPVPIVTVNQTEVEIKDAKNTTYNDCLVSRMIANTDINATWKYFVGTAGREVVEVTGTIPFINSKDKILSNLVSELSLSKYDSTNDAILTGLEFDSSKIKDISFRIQFVKHIDNEPEQGQVYNRYYRSYAEVCITPISGSKITVKANAGIFPFLFSCLNGGLFY